MIEQGISRKIEEAQAQGWKQQVLTRFLYTGFRLLKACGLTDVTGEALGIPSTKEEKRWSSQVERLIDLGFHAELGLSEDEYRVRIPAFQPQPDRFRGRFDLPLLVDPEVSLERQLALLKVKTDLTPAELTRLSLSEIQKRVTPYQIWVRINARNNSGRYSIEWIEDRERGWDEQPLSVIQGLALFRELPNALSETYHMTLADSWLNSEETIRLEPENFTDYKPILRRDGAYKLMKKMPHVTKGKLN
ncbi:hypothetical protein HYS92_01450 [Candidatus Daviesbacteria bacterium]|nr:hypothetical protein [Candidatus Daviesbacteria bacterium]